MKNCDMKVVGDVLTITIDLKQKHGASKSGKTDIVATTGGNTPLPSHPSIRVGVNVFSEK